MGQGPGQKASVGTLTRAALVGTLTRAALAGALGLLASGLVYAQLNPFSVLGKVVTTSLDVRSKAEVAADSEISAGISRRLLEDKQSEWAGVTALVFAQQVVLAGAVKSADVKKRVEEVAKRQRWHRPVGIARGRLRLLGLAAALFGVGRRRHAWSRRRGSTARAR